MIATYLHINITKYNNKKRRKRRKKKRKEFGQGQIYI